MAKKASFGPKITRFYEENHKYTIFSLVCLEILTINEPRQPNNLSTHTMENTIPINLKKLAVLGLKMAGGLAKHAETLGMKHHTQETVAAEVKAVEDADTLYQASRVSRRTKLSPDKVKADAEGRAFIDAAKKVLRHQLGNSWTEAWVEAGFVNGTTATPTSYDERVGLIRKLAAYFAKHADWENEKLEVSAAKAVELHEAMSAAREALDAQKADQKQLKEEREAAVKTLRSRVSGVMGELRLVLGPRDPMWHNFGLNRPGDPYTPDVPGELELRPMEGGGLLATWEDAARAERYRVAWKEGGGEFVDAGSTAEPRLVLSGVSGEADRVEVRVRAVNDAGESGPVEEEVMLNH